MKDEDVAMGLITVGASAVAVYSTLPDDVKRAIKELVREVAKGAVEGLIEKVKRMDDERLVDEIARLWVALGGDAEGFEWLKEKIKQRIKELEEGEE